VVFPDHGKRGYARLFSRERTYQLDVGIEIFPGWTVLESFAGIGTDTEAALKDAFDAFLRGALHVMLAAFDSGNSLCGRLNPTEPPPSTSSQRARGRGLSPFKATPRFGRRTPEAQCHRLEVLHNGREVELIASSCEAAAVARCSSDGSAACDTRWQPTAFAITLHVGVQPQSPDCGSGGRPFEPGQRYQ
jgi:Family of unknown function (DUF6348)